MGKPRQAPAPVRADGAGRRLELERYLPSLVTAIANKLSRSANADYQTRFGVNVTEWRIMSLLALEPGISATRICQVIGFDKGPVSRTLKRMEARDLVAIETDPAQARKHAIMLTARGLATHDEVITVALDRERRLLACLRKSERETLISLVRRVHDNLDAVGEDHRRAAKAARRHVAAPIDMAARLRKSKPGSATS